MKKTHENIMNAARELFSTNGYAATTTKDIANKAGISEVTLFRHFESKRKLFHDTLHSTIESDLLINFFEHEVEYDLEKDLPTLADHLHTLYKDNSDLIKMMLKDKESRSFKEISGPIKEKKLKTYSDAYFTKMYEMGKIADDPVMCRKFFFHNTVGFLMRMYVMERCDDGLDYYNWMVIKTINAIKIDKN